MSQMAGCAVECREISFAYGERKVIDNLSLCIERGALHALVGPDGAGKSTLIKLIATILKPDEGEIFIEGSPALPSRQIRRMIGYLPQDFNLYPDLTVKETLEFFGGVYGMGRRELSRKISELVEVVGLEEKINVRAGSLSGGMKQKLLLITSIIHDPPVLLLDEPSTGIDPVSRHELWQYIYHLHGRGTTILVATPFMEEAERCEKITFLYAGRKLVEGSPEDIKVNFKYNVLEITPELAAEITGHKGVVEIEYLSGRLLAVVEKDFHLDGADIKEIEPGLELIFQYLLGEAV